MRGRDVLARAVPFTARIRLSPVGDVQQEQKAVGRLAGDTRRMMPRDIVRELAHLILEMRDHSRWSRIRKCRPAPCADLILKVLHVAFS